MHTSTVLAHFALSIQERAKKSTHPYRMWYLRWEKYHVTRIHCYIFSEIFLLTFFTGMHNVKAIGLQQGKSLVLTQNKDSNLKTEWASERNSETRSKLQCMNRTVSLPSWCQTQAHPASLPTEETIPSLISRRITRGLLFLHKRYLFLSCSCEHWWESIHLAAFCWKQLQSASNPISPWWSG